MVLQDFILDKNVDIEPYYTIPVSSPQTSEGGRKMEYLNRGVSAVSTGKSVFVSWRLLGTDDDNIAFKATPHKDCAADAQSDFSSDCIKITQAG